MLQLFSRDLDPINYGLWRPLLRQLDEVIEKPASRFSEVEPPYDLQETDDHYLLSVDVPGVQREDLSIELTGNRLVIAGERKMEGRSVRRGFGKFHQTFTLPDGVSAEGLAAEHRDGVLRLSIPKPSAVKPTKIEIGDGRSGFLRN